MQPQKMIISQQNCCIQIIPGQFVPFAAAAMLVGPTKSPIGRIRLPHATILRMTTPEDRNHTAQHILL